VAGDDHRGKRVPPVRVRRSGDRPAVRAGVPAAGWRAAWELVRTAGAARRAGRAAPTDPAGRLSVPCSCGGGAGPPAGTPSRRYRRPDADGGGLAGALAGLPHRHRAVDRARLCRARAPVPGPVPGGGAAGRAVCCPGAGHVRRDHPPAPGPGHAGLGRDLDPDPGHAAGCAERRDPPGTADGEPGRQGRTAPRAPPAGGGLDALPDRTVAADRGAARGRGVDRPADRAVPAQHRRAPAVCMPPTT
jgi:hypothetical protein